jgi:pimeloyl-ACP methyl ester carboxylesterase
MTRYKVLLAVCLLIGTASAVPNAPQVPAAVVSDPAPDPAYPASMEAPDVLSHGARMYTVFYLASGAGPHPTVLLVHGFPGNEKNMDLAYSIRRAGWNVLVPFCRGSWGSEGTYSFTHAIEDAQSAVEFLRDASNVKKYRIDSRRIVLIGHSVGGFVVSYVAAHDSDIFGVAMVAASNLGPSTIRALSRDSNELHNRFRSNASRLVGATPDALLDEVKQNAANWDYVTYATALRSRPVLIVEVDDRNVSDNEAFAVALKKAGNSRVTKMHLATDHTMSDHRIAQQAAVVSWLLRIARPATR